MSTTYSVACKDCRQKYWAGQSSAGSEIRFYEPEKVCRFVLQHYGHDLTFLSDGSDQFEGFDEWSEQ